MKEIIMGMYGHVTYTVHRKGGVFHVQDYIKAEETNKQTNTFTSHMFIFKIFQNQIIKYI